MSSSYYRNFDGQILQEFEDTEEDKLTCMLIFNKCISLIEKYIEQQLLEWIPEFNMAAFATLLQHYKDGMAGHVFDMQLTFMNFLSKKCF